MTAISIERKDSGPADQDRTSASWFADSETTRAERELREQFARAVAAGDANALCKWAPMVTDWNSVNRLPVEQRTTVSLPKRAQAMDELMVESLLPRNVPGTGPTMTEAMHLILAATKSTDHDLAVLAGDLVERMGAAFATNNAGV